MRLGADPDIQLMAATRPIVAIQAALHRSRKLPFVYPSPKHGHATVVTMNGLEAFAGQHTTPSSMTKRFQPLFALPHGRPRRSLRVGFELRGEVAV